MLIKLRKEEYYTLVDITVLIFFEDDLEDDGVSPQFDRSTMFCNTLLKYWDMITIIMNMYDINCIEYMTGKFFTSE